MMKYEDVINQVDALLWKLSYKYSIKGYTPEDIHQELLMKVFDVYKDYNDKYALTTYLQTVLENFLKNKCKKDNLDKNVNKVNGKPIKDIKNYDFSRLLKSQTIYSKSQEEILDIAYSTLENFKNKNIIVKLLNGFKQVEIAKELNVSKQYISKQWSDYLKIVKEEIEKKEN